MRLLYIALLLSALSFGQDRNGISYQALILNPQGEQLPGANNNTVPMANTEVCLRFHITTNAGSYNEYSERQVLTTDAYGMINTVVGTGAPVGTIMWNQIVWTEDSKGLKVEIDYSGECSSFVALSSQELTSVPFALYSPASNIPGPPGEAGDSAYQVWIDEGNTGTEQEFLDSLKGTDGEPGDPGADGDSAYQLWIDEGNTGTEQEFLDSLKGTDGEPGDPGADGLLDSGDNTGDIVYWNGSQWTILPIGSEGDVLTVINGVPSWGQQATDEPPIITLIGDNPLNLNVGDEYIELGATAYDQVDGDITSNIVSDSSLVNTSLSGSYNVTYIVTDSSGNKTTKVREVNVINPSGLIYIPDDAFEQHLIDLNLDDVMDDYVLKSNVVDLKYLFFSPGFNLIGIEHFLSLESVNFNASNTIETIDLSNLTSLKEITVHSNAVLSQLILPNINSSVERILIHSNGYASTPAFNVEFLISGLSNQSGLKYLGLLDSEENIESLDLSKLTQLDDIWLSSSVLTSLDLSNNVNLKSIILSLNSANSLNFSNNINLKELSISGSSLTSINMTKNNLLEDLIITGTLINNLDLSQCSSLINVDIENNNQLVNINLANSNNQSINIFDASSNSSLNCIQIDENFSPPSPVFNNTHLSNYPPHYWYFYINYYSSAGEPKPNNSNSNNFGGNPMWSISPPESWTQQNIQDAGYDPSYSQQACGDGSDNTTSDTIPADLQIGEEWGGGIVVYIDPTRNSARIMAKVEYLSQPLPFDSENQGDYYISPGITNQVNEDYYGGDNTQALVDFALDPNKTAKNEAAMYCNSIVIEGYDDWYLPTLREMSDATTLIWEHIYFPGLDLWTSLMEPNQKARYLNAIINGGNPYLQPQVSDRNMYDGVRRALPFRTAGVKP